ncbi:MAG: CapA family protein [Calditrichaeota bacterium]|nr:CapA family protein [Calditrichota bacterium]MCB9367670.1 CapA family protein [Calditrichota bacterium]
MKRLHELLSALILIGLAANPVAADRVGHNSLDEQATTLTILKTDDGLSLHWIPSDTLHYWAVTFSRQTTMASLDTLAVTTDTFYVHHDAEGLFDLGFFRIDPVEITPPVPVTDVIMSFYDAPATPIFHSVPGEDMEPLSYDVNAEDQFGESGQSLIMTGNTWKYIDILPHHVDSTDTWAVAMKLLQLGELHAFGVADSENYMYYLIWGKEAPQSLHWITCYEGYFEQDEWIDIELSIGEDWQGRFGYAPNITKLYFINDNDTVETDGVVRFDEVRDISGAVPHSPIVDFTWVFAGDSDPDSVTVAFHSYSYDLDSPLLTHRWDFGDGKSSHLSHPVHTYAAHGRYPVTLTVTDDGGRASCLSEAVIDSPATATRDIWFAFTGDVILGRGYENNGGIIDSWGVDTIFSPTYPWIQTADLASVNLECPFTTATVRHPTKGIVFKADPASVSGLVNAGIDFVTLANNHVFDYLIPGMVQTMDVLDSVGIVYNGSGLNDELARQVRFLSANGISFGMLSFSDRTGSYNNYQPFLDAGRSRAGFAMWNRAAIDATVEEATQLADFVVINTHSGSEYSEEPILGMNDALDPFGDEDMLFELIPDTAERQIRQYAIDMGAEMVIAHHPHIIQGFEVYHDKLIAHSLGNFVFDLTYAETMPSLILRTHVDGNLGVDQAVVHPVYINHWIPQPARGELARNLLDYETAKSRDLDTWLVRPPGADSAFIVFDTNMVTRVGVDTTVTLTATQSGAWWVSAPHKLAMDGYVVSGEVTDITGCEIRVGREMVLFGNMEDEGSNDWLLNSGDEGYANDTVHTGDRSIWLRRVAGNPSNVVTFNQYRFPFNGIPQYTMCGWVKADNAVSAAFQVEFYGQRSGGTLLQQVNVGAPISGTADWTFRQANLTPPGGSNFVVIRMTLNAPASGTGYAWFDDASLIQWDDWMESPATVTFPNDYHWVQVRSATNVATLTLDYRREWVDFVPPARLSHAVR